MVYLCALSSKVHLEFTPGEETGLTLPRSSRCGFGFGQVWLISCRKTVNKRLMQALAQDKEMMLELGCIEVSQMFYQNSNEPDRGLKQELYL